MAEKEKAAFGKIISMSRAAIGRSPEEIATRAGMSPQKLIYLEQGKIHSLSPDIIDRLADSLFVQSSPERLIPAQAIIMHQKEVIVDLTNRVIKLTAKCSAFQKPRTNSH
jgi:transcriptional regulator with XRE-family HTH domain